MNKVNRYIAVVFVAAVAAGASLWLIRRPDPDGLSKAQSANEQPVQSNHRPKGLSLPKPILPSDGVSMNRVDANASTKEKRLQAEAVLEEQGNKARLLLIQRQTKQLEKAIALAEKDGNLERVRLMRKRLAYLKNAKIEAEAAD